MPDPAAMPDKPRLRRPKGSDRVPVLPPGVPYLLQALNNDNLTFFQIARAIEHVPSVAARLLALANSAWSAPASPVTSIEAACSRLGMRVVRSASIALAISQPFNPARCPPFHGATFWGSALLNAEAAAWLADKVLRDQRATARTAGLLRNFGLVWLADTMPVETGLALTAVQDGPPGRLDHALEQHCGLGYTEAGALLADAWLLPAALRDAIGDQGRGAAHAAPLNQVVNAACKMVGAVRRDLEWSKPDRGLLKLGLEMPVQCVGIEYLRAVQQRTVAMAEALFAGC